MPIPQNKLNIIDVINQLNDDITNAQLYDVTPNIVGVDYSMTSPCICIHGGYHQEFKIENCKFFFRTDRKFLEGWHGDKRYHGTLVDKNDDDKIVRFHKISNWAMEKIHRAGRGMIGLEGYSMGSSAGRSFDIAENTALLKFKLHCEQRSYKIIPPTVIKKFATGKGNARKELMYETFVQETGVNLMELLTPKSSKVGNPVSDIVDSFYIAKYVHSGK